MNSDEEFDNEAYAAFEDELYDEESLSGSEDELDSELEETLYSEVHYASSLLVADDFSPGGRSPTIGKATSDVTNKESSLGKKNSLEISVIEIISSDDDDCGQNVELNAAHCSYPEVVKIFSEEHSTTSSHVKESPHEGNRSGKDRENWDLDARDLVDAVVTKQRPRYYKPGKVPSYIRCYNCNERGHMSESCPEPKKTSVCYLCGFPGHVRRFCPNELCFNCHEPGHQSKQCRKPRTRPFDRCKRCHMAGHLARNCPDHWRQYHVTTQAGPVTQPTSYPSPTQDLFCYNCAEQGHYGHECTQERPWRTAAPVLPFIVCYDGCAVPSTRKRQNKQSHRREPRREVDHQTTYEPHQERRVVHLETELFQPPPEKKHKRFHDERTRNVSFDDSGNFDTPHTDLPSSGHKKRKRKRKKKQQHSESDIDPPRRVVEIVDPSPPDDDLIEEPRQVRKVGKHGKQRWRNSDRFGNNNNNNFNSKQAYDRGFSNSSHEKDYGSFQGREYESRKNSYNPRRGGRGFVSSRGFRFYNGTRGRS